MTFKYLFDKDLNDIHFIKHGVSKEEVYEFFHDILYLERKRKDKSFESIGKLLSGRYLKVVYRTLKDGTYFIITAFDIFDNDEKSLIEKELRRL